MSHQNVDVIFELGLDTVMNSPRRCFFFSLRDMLKLI